MWFAIVGKRAAHSTTARTRVPGSSSPRRPSRRTSTWSSPNLSTSTQLEPPLGAVRRRGSRCRSPGRRSRRRTARLSSFEELPRSELRADRDDRGQDVGRLVADELAARMPGADDLRGQLLGRALAARARDLAVALHQLAEAVDVDRLTALLGELLRQLDREAVGGREREGLLARRSPRGPRARRTPSGRARASRGSAPPRAGRRARSRRRARRARGRRRPSARATTPPRR